MESTKLNTASLEKKLSMVMTKCEATTKEGRPCSVLAEHFRNGYCHVHDPNGTFQTQVFAKKSQKKTKKELRKEVTDIREELAKKISTIDANWRDGSPKSATAILAEAIAIVSGRQ